MLNFERINEVIDIDEHFPAINTTWDAKTLSLSEDEGEKTQVLIEAPSHTRNALSASNIHTLVNPDQEQYYNDVLGMDGLRDALVYDAMEGTFPENRSLSQTFLNNLLEDKSANRFMPRKLSRGQTLFAPEPSQIVAIYYRLAEQLSEKLSINELNFVNNTHGYPSAFGKGNANLRTLNHNVLSLNDYYVPFFDNLYRTCVNDNVLVHIRSSYENLYQSPEDVSIQSSAGASNNFSISSLRQARSFIHGVTWLMLSTAMNNIFGAVRAMSFANWSAKLSDALTPQKMTIFDEPDPKQQAAIDDFERLKASIIGWIEGMLISRRATLSTHPRYANLHSPEGCITLFEAHRWVSVKAGEVYLESKHVVTTANLLMFSGYLDQLLGSIDTDGTVQRFEVAKNWMTPQYLIAAITNCKDVAEIIDENEGVKKAFERAVLDNHRHYYPPSALI